MLKVIVFKIAQITRNSAGVDHSNRNRFRPNQVQSLQDTFLRLSWSSFPWHANRFPSFNLMPTETLQIDRNYSITSFQMKSLVHQFFRRPWRWPHLLEDETWLFDTEKRKEKILIHLHFCSFPGWQDNSSAMASMRSTTVLKDVHINDVLFLVLPVNR